MNRDTGQIYTDEAAIKAAQERGEKLLRIPYPPKKGCSYCNGRGFIKSFAMIEKHILCPGCYPMNERHLWQSKPNTVAP